MEAALESQANKHISGRVAHSIRLRASGAKRLRMRRSSRKVDSIMFRSAFICFQCNLHRNKQTAFDQTEP